MTSRGDDDPNAPSDPVLDSMRTVWLSMRDEEPPAAGLSQLLAAARTKAEAMQPKPVWWRRALIAFKRPPVLALATTVLLLGGAVVVVSRQDQLLKTEEPAPSLDRAPARTPGMGSASTTTLDIAPMTPPVGGEDDKLATPEPAPDRDAPAPEPPAPPRQRPQTRTAPRPPARAEPTPEVTTKPPADQVVPAPPPPSPPAPAPAPPKATGRSSADSGLSIAQDPEPTVGSSAPDFQLKNSATSTDEAVDLSGQRNDPRPSMVEQLAKQSTTAAAHGDCPAVRAITSRMQKLNKAAYRTHVANNASVKSCLTR